jgi:type VI secretion system protein VasJ
MAMTAEEILKLADVWAAPISAAQPGGSNAVEDPRYEVVTNAIGSLDSVTATPDWKNLWPNIIQSGGALLQEKSKEFRIANYVAYALYRQDGLPGLLKGVALVTVLIEGFWATMFPEVKRIKGRAAALQWFIERSLQQIEAHKTVPSDRATLDNLKVGVRRLYDSASDKFGDSCPAIRPLLEQIDRRLMDAGPDPAEAERQKAEEDKQRAEEEKRRAEEAERARQQQAQQPAQPTQPQAPQPAQPPVVQPPQPPVVTGPAVVVAAPTATVTAAPTDVSQVAQWLSGVGATVVQTANAVRRAADSTALAYRMTRVGLYTHLVDAPPADAAGKTRVPPPPANLRKQVETLAANQKWAALIEETESALSQSRFWLDLHRYTAQALAGLGPNHAKAREEVLREVATVLRRLPQVPTLQFADGTPFADGATQQWFTAEVLAGGGGGAAPSAGAPAGAVVVVQQGGGGAGEEAAIVAEAKKMAAAGKAGDALAMLQAKATSAPSDAGRFRYRLGIGQVCLAANQAALAKGVFEGLEREIAAHGLEQWEPALAAASAEGLVLCYRALAKGGKPIPPEAGVLYDRVCRLDPAAALRIGAS